MFIYTLKIQKYNITLESTQCEVTATIKKKIKNMFMLQSVFTNRISIRYNQEFYSVLESKR